MLVTEGAACWNHWVGAAGRRVSARATVALLGTVVMLAVPLACSEDDSALLRLREGCSLNSDCEEGLVCAFGVCHAACETSKDCDAGRCIVDEGRGRVCQFEEAKTCAFNSECPPPLICGRDGACRNQCATDRDCVPGQVCRVTTCAEPEELEDDTLPPSPDVDPVGFPCALSSDCPAGPGGEVLVCRSNLCSYACFTTVDCARYYRCSTDTDETVPGDCVLIGEPGKLFCDPAKDAPRECPCPGGGISTQVCAEDGSEFLDCQC